MGWNRPQDIYTSMQNVETSPGPDTEILKGEGGGGWGALKLGEFYR